MKLKVFNLLISEGFATVTEAAKELGCSGERVRQLCRAGTLRHGKHGKKYVIPWVVLREYAQELLKRTNSAA
ncbi:MAG: helix-turn-helix domain-containing protein [Patescibacteria group bacterium]|nr:helix-turn-helix domain-containing protein [Patescibacteria group bacterium]